METAIIDLQKYADKKLERYIQVWMDEGEVFTSRQVTQQELDECLRLLKPGRFFEPSNVA